MPKSRWVITEQSTCIRFGKELCMYCQTKVSEMILAGDSRPATLDSL